MRVSLDSGNWCSHVTLSFTSCVNLAELLDDSSVICQLGMPLCHEAPGKKGKHEALAVEGHYNYVILCV